jgi:nitrite reductase/ring-hydroxylating ferredoxin subunit
LSFYELQKCTIINIVYIANTYNMSKDEGEKGGQYQKVANKSDLQEGGMIKVQPNGKQIVLSMVEGKVYAMDNICTHRGGPLNEGELNGHNLKCPWHYAVFDVRNGKVSDRTVWATNLNSYPVRVNETNGDILVNPSRGANV